MKNRSMVIAATVAMALAAGGLAGASVTHPSGPAAPPRPPKPNDGRLPHQGAREIARRKRQMERNAKRKERADG